MCKAQNCFGFFVIIPLWSICWFVQRKCITLKVLNRRACACGALVRLYVWRLYFYPIQNMPVTFIFCARMSFIFVVMKWHGFRAVFIFVLFLNCICFLCILVFRFSWLTNITKINFWRKVILRPEKRYSFNIYVINFV